MLSTDIGAKYKERCANCNKLLRQLKRYSLKINSSAINTYLVSAINRNRDGDLVNSEIESICSTCRLFLIRERDNAATVRVEMEVDDQYENEIDDNEEAVIENHIENVASGENLASVEGVFENEVEQVNDRSISSISLSINRCPISHVRCIFNCANTTALMNVPPIIRRVLLIEYNFYVPEGCRFCASHLSTDNFSNLIQRTPRKFNEQLVEEMFHMMKNMITERQNTSSTLDLESEHIIKEWTGLSKENFTYLLSVVKKLNSSELFIYLAKLRTGISNERLATFFNITRYGAEYRMNKARDALTTYFVPAYLGLSHINREALKLNMTSISRALFCENQIDNIVSIWDATYIYIQKSSNYEFQRKSYSMHKKRPLIKPMMAVAPNGYILDVFGPYPANLNDAEILKKILHEKNNLNEVLIENDVFLVDRGFRDSISTLEAAGFVGRMPSFVENNTTQLTWEQANQSRFITKCRYAVEVINGRLKKVFKYFDNVWCNQSIPHLMTDFRVAAALHNAFYERLESDSENSEDIIKLMLERFNIPNFMANLVIDNNLNCKSASFSDINECDIEFPLIDEDDLKLISLGSYQIKQSKSYYAEHVKVDGNYKIQVCKLTDSLELSKYNVLVGCPLLLRARVIRIKQNILCIYYLI